MGAAVAEGLGGGPQYENKEFCDLVVDITDKDEPKPKRSGKEANWGRVVRRETSAILARNSGEDCKSLAILFPLCSLGFRVLLPQKNS